MNSFMFAIILLNFPILVITTLNLSLKTWNLRKSNYRTIEEAIKEYFETRTYLLSVAIRLEHSQHWEWYIQDYLTDVLRRTNLMSFEIFFHRKGYERKPKASYHNVFYVDSHDAFVRLLPLIENDYIRAMGQYMVIMNIAKHLQNKKEIHLILKTAFQWKIVDIAVGTYVGKGVFDLYTFDIFLPQQCRQVVPRQFNVFKRGRFDSEELFPDKLRNFHKCPIEMYIRTAVPYFSYRLTKDQKQILDYEGLEAKIIQTMAQVLNFDIRFSYWNDVDPGSVIANGTVTGAFQLLRQNEIDTIIGFFCNPTRYRYFAASTPYYLTSQVMVIRKPRRTSSDAMWLMEPFRKSVWLMIILTVIVGMALVSFLYYNLKSPARYTICMTWLDMFGLALGTSRSYEYRYFATKYGFVMWTLGFLVICASFGGKLYVAFNRMPVSHPITVTQLIKANYTFIILPFLAEDLIKELKIPEQQIEDNNSPDDEIIYEAMLYDNRKRALLTNYWQFQAFLAVRNLYAEFDMVPEALMTNQICAYMHPQSFFVEPFNNLLGAFDSFGILDKWMLDAAGHYGIMNKIESTHEPKSLSLAKVQVVFIGLLVLYMMALLVFLGEVMVKKLGIKYGSICVTLNSFNLYFIAK